MTKLFLVISILLSSLCNLIALDIKKDIQGEQCTVIEPVRNFTFDFNEIISELGYHINGADDNLGQYFFNLCKPLNRKCKNQTVAACLIKHRSREEVIIGYDSKLYWNDGQIRLSYVGEECKDKTNYTLNVMLHCDYQNNNDFLGVFHLEDQCEVNIFMKTSKACLPIPENVKKAKMFVKTSSNKTLNFNALKSSNHIVNGGSFVIGFPLLYSHDIMCEAGSTVCFINNTETDIMKKFKNVGMMTSDIKFETDHPVLVLTSNEECNATKKYSSKITFICDNLISEGTPKFIKENDCTNFFEWETKYACVDDEKSCQISGPNGEFYDFSSLVGLQYSIPRSNKSNNEMIHFSLCSPAKECDNENWGSCIIKTDENGVRQTTNIGDFNTKLQIDSKNVFLKYDGPKCNGKGDLFSTRIEFMVADEAKDEEVVLIEDKCEIVLHLKTLLVNQNVKNCVVKNRYDAEFDLRPLIDYNGNYEATIDKDTKESTDARYFINVCRPLNSKYSLDCHGNSAACRTVVKDGKHEEELSLGHFEYAMTTEPGKDGTTNVLMKYFHGSKCPIDNEEHIITIITFYCDNLAGLGNPILKSTDQCVYSFDFPTNILCNEQYLTLKSSDSSCELLNDKTNKSINLRTFGIFENDNVKVDICDNVTKFYTLNYKDSMIVIEYGSKDKDIQVQLKCNVKNNTKIDVSQDKILVMHESNFACAFMNIVPRMMEFVASTKSDFGEKTVTDAPTKDEQKKHDETSAGFSMGYIFLIICLIVAFGAFYLVIRHPERREIILSMVKFRSRRNIRYARINLSEESALLTDNNDLIASDSDDENILL